jgi:hypothetical protein
MPTFPVKGKPLSNWLQEWFDKPCDSNTNKTNRVIKKTDLIKTMDKSTERAKK